MDYDPTICTYHALCGAGTATSVDTTDSTNKNKHFQYTFSNAIRSRLSEINPLLGDDFIKAIQDCNAGPEGTGGTGGGAGGAAGTFGAAILSGSFILGCLMGESYTVFSDSIAGTSDAAIKSGQLKKSHVFREQQQGIIVSTDIDVYYITRPSVTTSELATIGHLDSGAIPKHYNSPLCEYLYHKVIKQQEHLWSFDNYAWLSSVATIREYYVKDNRFPGINTYAKVQCICMPRLGASGSHGDGKTHAAGKRDKHGKKGDHSERGEHGERGENFTDLQSLEKYINYFDFKFCSNYFDGHKVVIGDLDSLLYRRSNTIDPEKSINRLFRPDNVGHPDNPHFSKEHPWQRLARVAKYSGRGFTITDFVWPEQVLVELYRRQQYYRGPGPRFIISRTKPKCELFYYLRNCKLINVVYFNDEFPEGSQDFFLKHRDPDAAYW